MFVILLPGVLSVYAQMVLCQNPGGASPPKPVYDLTFDSEVFTVIGADKIDTTRISCEQHNETIAFMFGEFEILEDLDDISCEIVLSRDEQGQLQVIFSHDICDVCGELSDSGSQYKRYIQYMSLPTSCPFKAGVIPVHNLMVDIGDFEIQDQHCGPYVAEITVNKKTGENCKNDREVLFVLKLYLSINRRE